MSDDHSQRYRSNDATARGGSRLPPVNDPLAELARLIGQNDPFGEYGRAPARPGTAPAEETQPQVAHEWAGQGYAQSYVATPPRGPEPQPYGAPSFSADAAYQDHQGHQAHMNQPGEPPQPGYEQGGYPAGNSYGAEGDDYYDDAPPPRRRTGILVIAGIFVLAVLGTAGAFGYRALFGSSGSRGQPPVIQADSAPSKVVPAGSRDTSKQITDRVGGSPSERLVSREEQPVDMKDKALIVPDRPAAAQQGAPGAPLGSGVVASEPKRIRTIAITPDSATASANAAMPSASAPPMAMPEVTPRPVTTTSIPTRPNANAALAAPSPVQPSAPPQAAAPRQAAPSAGPMSLNPGAQPSAPVAPPRTANAAPTSLAPQAGGGGSAFAVQVTSQRSEAEAQAAYRALLGKFPGALGGKPYFIYRVDLGDKGTYYRAMIGPYTSNSGATEVCSSLRSAGGQCLIQKN